MITLNKRLEIRLDEATFNLLQETAKKMHTSIGEVVRTAIIQIYAQKKKNNRLGAFKKICRMNAPVCDWPQMEKEIEQGR